MSVDGAGVGLSGAAGQGAGALWSGATGKGWLWATLGEEVGAECVQTCKGGIQGMHEATRIRSTPSCFSAPLPAALFCSAEARDGCQLRLLLLYKAS